MSKRANPWEPLSTIQIQECLVGSIVDDVCDFFPRFIGREDLAQELAKVCEDYIPQVLGFEFGRFNSDFLENATKRQQNASAKWGPTLKAMIYVKLGVRMPS